MSDNIETLDDILGEGAFDDFEAMVSLNGEGPEIIQSLFEVDGESITWPPDLGPSICMIIKWPHADVITHIQGTKLYVGDGMCDATSDPNDVVQMLLQMRELMVGYDDKPLLTWCRKWGITEMVIPTPVVLADNWRIFGFDETVHPQRNNWMIMSASLEEGGKLDRFSSWVASGMNEELRPDWVEAPIQPLG